MASKSTVVNFPESTSQSRSQKITIPNLKRVVSVTVNTGKVTHSVNGNEVTINVSDGSYTRYTTSSSTASKTVSDTRTSSTDSFSSTISYNDGTYSGTLSKSGSSTSYVVSGSPPGQKTASDTRSASHERAVDCSQAQSGALANLPASVSYSDGEGYSGVLQRTGTSVGSCQRYYYGDGRYLYTASATGNYSGQVSKPDTRVYNYSQSYSGTVYGPSQTYFTYYYAYTVTVTYEDNFGQTLTLSAPANGMKLSVGNTYMVTGTTLDTDPGDIVSVYVRVNKGTNYRIAQGSVDGVNPLAFNKTLTLTGGALKDGTTAVSGLLDEGATHLLEVWSEDNKGGTSIIAERTFTVMLNRPPTLTHTFVANNDNLSDDSPITINGTVSDPDGQAVSMKYRLNGGADVPISISGGAWTITVTPKQMVNGSNSLVITAADSLGATTVLTFSLTRSVTKTRLKTSHARYKLSPQSTTAKEVLAWLQHETGDLNVDGALSIVAAGAAESYKAMTKTSAPVITGIVETEFIGTYATGNAQLHLKLTLSSNDANSTAAATSLSGAIKA
ncbi:Ig-like domain-containing protein [Brevibacillus brevis]|uniref:Ig-like domain-containing protein n=1 Tax=Brevibacillus brevis TaxID=1393 RepID=UPI000D104110|nr:hypothetical protein [Brevibacillus brevis]PSJ67329.1 hypothetical protein C7J99_21350 [Brevibacillus brevis]RED21676.1 hypothetical protein DES34_119103 [Brevibacillus brevis]GEC93836.1 hypothetical protein BBR01nite_61670 [Brevibacillus brevis]VEF86652.1 Uncharacterised protein [Brevibacillus brevis]